MVKFETAFEKTMKNEGFYSNDPEDPGGETFMGIARKFHPDWEGWEIIDIYKDAEGDLKLPDYHIDNLRTKVKRFYEIKFWIKSGADRVSSQVIANELFDSAVNVSPKRAVQFLQDSLNLLNRNQTDYEDMKVDGVFGNITLTTLEKRLRIPGEEMYIYMSMNNLQGNYYATRCRNNPTQEKFYRGFLERAQTKEHSKIKKTDR